MEKPWWLWAAYGNCCKMITACHFTRAGKAMKWFLMHGCNPFDNNFHYNNFTKCIQILYQFQRVLSWNIPKSPKCAQPSVPFCARHQSGSRRQHLNIRTRCNSGMRWPRHWQTTSSIHLLGPSWSSRRIAFLSLRKLLRYLRFRVPRSVATAQVCCRDLRMSIPSAAACNSIFGWIRYNMI